MSCHEGVSCDNCMKSNFSGKRFKCLICYDYDLCEYCHALSVATSRHQASHPMQCILTRNEFEKYYAGESITPESPPSFVCPFCSQLGFTETLLQEHVAKTHEDVHKEVICPVCAALPSGDPNLVTEDLAHHLSMEHRGSRDNDEQTTSRHIRRMFYPGRGIRTRNHRSMHLSGGPIGSSMNSSNLLSNSNSTSLRDSMDPITELLSQLSGVRRSAQQLQQNVSTASQLQELQAQLQLERQRAAEIRQQLERFPNKLSSDGATAPNTNSRSYAEVASSSKTTVSTKKSIKSDNDGEKFLLSKLDNINLSASELEKQNRDDEERSYFVQDLLLSMLSKRSDRSEKKQQNLEKAVPVLCGSYAQAIDLKSDLTTSDNLNLSGDDKVKTSVEASVSAGDISSNKTIVKNKSKSVTARSPDWHFENNHQEKESDDDDDRAPSPTPALQGRGRLLQSRMYTPGTVSISGFQDPALLAASFGREDIGAGNVSKHVH